MAVKTLSRSRMKDIDKFMQEVSLMKKFNHANIVCLLGKQLTFHLVNLSLHGLPVLCIQCGGLPVMDCYSVGMIECTVHTQ